MKTAVYNWSKKKTGDVDLDSTVFGQKWRLDIISEVVRWQRAKKRQGSHNTKNKGEVSGGGAKPFRQKGTGRARQGSIRSPLLRGGGAAHGPHPRDYTQALPVKVRQLGMKSLLSHVYSQKKLFIVEDMASPEGKTKELCSRLKKFGLDRALLVDKEKDPLFHRACRNLPSYQFMKTEGVNVFDILKYKNLVLTKNALHTLSLRLSAKRSRGAGAGKREQA